MNAITKVVCLLRRIALASLATFSVMSVAGAAEKDDLASAISAGEPSIVVRYRYEHVDQDFIADDADASTLLIRMNYRTGLWNGLSAFGEFDHTIHALIDDFNSGAGTSPNNGQYPVVADPSGSDLNQLYIDFESANGWKARFGRQRILFDNQRFVGGVAWRQNEQTYDGLTVTTSAITNTYLSYTYLSYVRRIFGQTVPAGDDALDGHLLNAKVSITDDWSVVPYFYYLDYDDFGRAANSTATFGAKLAGTLKTDAGNLQLFAELATQSDAANAPVNYDASYVHVGAIWALRKDLSLGLAFESLSGDIQPGMAFRTPLATLHAFQGWADKFLGTPTAGIEDLHVTAKYAVEKWNLTAVYHDFSAEASSVDYGSELDLSAGRSFGERYGVLFKGAFFKSDSVTLDDTNKFWIMLTARY